MQEGIIPLGDLATSKKSKFVTSARNEIQRLKFLQTRDGEAGAIQFAVRTYRGYYEAHRIGLEFKHRGKTAKSPYAGYGLEYRYQLLGSRYVLRRFLKEKGVSYVWPATTKKAE